MLGLSPIYIQNPRKIPGMFSGTKTIETKCRVLPVTLPETPQVLCSSASDGFSVAF